MKRNFKHIVAIITLLIAMFAYSYGQNPVGFSLGFEAELSAGGFKSDQNFGVMNFNARTNIFTSKNQKGFFVFTHGNIQTSLQQPLYGFGALGGGARFKPFPKEENFNSSIDFGIGLGIQTTPEKYIDELNRIVYQSTMRGMGFVNGQLPIRWGGHNHALVFQAGLDMSFDPWARKNTVAEFSYRYRALVTLEVTHFQSDINLFIGLHAERVLANGITVGLQFDKNRWQMGGIFGYNYDIQAPSGGLRVQVRL